MTQVMSLARTLWESNADLAGAALEHRFVRGLADGSLPVESFRSYVAQDAFFLKTNGGFGPSRSSSPASSRNWSYTRATRSNGASRSKGWSRSRRRSPTRTFCSLPLLWVA